MTLFMRHPFSGGPNPKRPTPHFLHSCRNRLHCATISWRSPRISSKAARLKSRAVHEYNSLAQSWEIEQTGKTKRSKVRFGELRQLRRCLFLRVPFWGWLKKGETTRKTTTTICWSKRKSGQTLSHPKLHSPIDLVHRSCVPNGAVAFEDPWAF